MGPIKNKKLLAWIHDRRSEQCDLRYVERFNNLSQETTECFNQMGVDKEEWTLTAWTNKSNSSLR